jgi:hypothetical protein
MERERDEDAKRVDQPAERPPDEGLAYDPAMTDTDEANIPPDSDADPVEESGQDSGQLD